MLKTQHTNNPSNVLNIPLRGGVVVEKVGENENPPMKTEKLRSLYGTSMGCLIRLYFSQSPLKNNLSEYFKAQLFTDCTELSRLAWLYGGCVVFNGTFVLIKKRSL